MRSPACWTGSWSGTLRQTLPSRQERIFGRAISLRRFNRDRGNPCEFNVPRVDKGQPREQLSTR
jgi:hypothetical protein